MEGGINFVGASLFISCATALAVLRIKKHVEGGKEITPTLEPIDGSISHPMPFKCDIVPRSAEAEALIWAE
ncbi:hypothetical protein AZE42_09524 [Rhizopogon vesiculosus]|uniref:Uncharacterized protein n=1 Tax=Rhizopogon vesiculosus TaxID=180088 RepID=A0A1J8PZR5_9AGAM|nr:hypothetical protein AZE42_09524 [Rhizopogon vesiculosus]